MDAGSTGAKRAAKSRQGAGLQAIPSVNDLLLRPRLVDFAKNAGHDLVVRAVRGVLDELRREAKNGSPEFATRIEPQSIENRVAESLEADLTPSLRPVINATGVVLHTNLGRAPLSIQAVTRIMETATRYTNLEYDVAAGKRGQRDVHTARPLAELLGAESAILVNNNAAAVFLVLNTLAKGFEVLVSRGELIEIGDGFRIPDIMRESGAVLCEVGTTNRTRIRDYEEAIGKKTRLLLRVHPSNFQISGFAARPSLNELAALSRRAKLPLFEDLGSGCVADLSEKGVSEPLAKSSIAAGVSVLTFSGDKLLGGPQAGIIAGKKAIVDRIRRNPLFRALRLDKLMIAALESTLESYRRGALDEVPALRMIRITAEEIASRAEKLSSEIQAVHAKDAVVEIVPGVSVVGGGSTPGQKLPTTVVSIASRRHSPSALEERLRNPKRGRPVIARIEKSRLVIDLRTVFRDEDSLLAAALNSALT